MKALHLVVVTTLIHYINCFFCSVYCAPNQCTGITNTQCTGCDAPFLFNSSQCLIDPASGFYIAANVNNITASPGTVTPCGPYSVVGPLPSTNTYSLTHNGPISAPHIKIRLIMWVILYDEWKTLTDYIQVKLVSTGQLYQYNVTFYSTQQYICATSNKYQWYIKIDYIYTHTDTTAPVVFLIKTKSTGGTKDYGIRQYMILAINCHGFCLTCTDLLSTTCTSCKTGYKLSGTTCAVNCLTQYGETNNLTLCVLCNVKCTVCYQTSTNCTACTISGTNEAFLYGFQCVNPCPTNYVPDPTNVCLQCTNPACLTCNVSNLSQCYTCNSSFYFYLADCYNPCPAATFPSAPNCIACDTSCSVCTGTPTPCTSCNTGYKLSGTTCATSCLPLYGQSSTLSLCLLCDLNCTACYLSPTNCSACTTSGSNEAFLYGFQCINPCPTNYLANTTNHICQLCTNPACISCSPTGRSICYSCNSSTLWFNFDCLYSCPSGYYPTSPNCTLCDISCLICTGSPTPCSSCNATYYFLNNSCLSTCPSGYFPHTPTMKCLSCATDCVTATLTLTLVSNTQLNAIITFNHPIDFTALPYQDFQIITVIDPIVQLTDFIITYQITSDRSYRIKIVPANDTLTFNNIMFIVDIDNNSSILYQSIDGYQFSDTIYDLIANITWTIQVKVWELETLQDVNDKINQFFAAQGIQQIKKAGIFALLFPGAQLCSTIILHNATPPTTMYEGARFWASFIYFEVPQWEQDGSGLKRFLTDLVKTILNNNSNARLLASNGTQIVDWRFSRTGHTGYFIFDAYIPIFVILLSWIPIIILNLLSARKPLIRRLKMFFYTTLHRLHQICMFYILMALCLEWVYYSNQTIEPYKLISLVLSFVFLLYCLIYQIHCFYKIIPYTYTDIGSHKFDFYIQKYSYFLRDIRYEEYGVYTHWYCSHFLRPYNYQILSFFRLALIIVCLPVFQSITYGCISCLIVIQFLQIIRFLLSWPYYSNWRNFYKLGLQIVLFGIFLLYLSADVIYQNNFGTDNTDWQNTYKIVGWAGFVLLIVYNIMYFVYFVIDVIIGCCFTNRQRMEHARNLFYRQMIQEYETYQDISNPTLKQSQVQTIFASSVASKKKGYISLINNLHKAEPAIEADSFKSYKQTIQLMKQKGNLYQHDYDKYWKVKLKIEQYELRSCDQNKYMINYSKIKDIFMHLKPDPHRKYNILIPQKKVKEVKITPLQNEFYFKIVDNIYKNYKTKDTQLVIVRTFMEIDQNLYIPGQKIPFNIQDMNQQIQVRQHSGCVKKQKLKTVLRGFPVADQLLAML